MYLFAWIFTGVVVGWLLGKALQGKSYGSARDFIMGIGGAAAGGILISMAGNPRFAGVIVSTFVAMVCAALMTSLVAMASGRRLLAPGPYPSAR
jgi:uncharacterized membrane protein YeaQ/YmgE (transglycosylase-associated protein family)